MAWYLYDLKGVPQFKFSDSDILPDEGSTNPFVQGNPVLAPKRSFTLYFMPATTPASVVTDMQAEGKNVALMPKVGSTDGVSIVSRSYWSFGKDGLGDYDRSGYGGPTNTPYPTLEAVTTDADTGQITDTPVTDCGSQSELPQRLWYDRDTGKPVITFEKATPPSPKEATSDLPKFLIQTGSVSGALGSEFPPSPVADEVQFYRNVASSTPYADVQSAPLEGNPPDACGGYVMANLPNDVVSVVRVPQVPSYPDYRGANADTPNDHDAYDVQFYSVVIYGASKQLDAYGTNENSQLGNRQIGEDADGGATFVFYPNAATDEQVEQIAAVARANGWNLLKSGVQTDVAPNLLVVREGTELDGEERPQRQPGDAGAPCPQSANPSLPLPQDPPSAAVTQSNGMGLSAPAGQNCSVDEFLPGDCVSKLSSRLAASGQVWSAQAAHGAGQKATVMLGGDGESLIAAHHAAGATFTAGGVQSFVRSEGTGTPVLLVHGLPASSYLYRKVIPELASHGLRAVAFDLPGMGLADRPTTFDYRISGLGDFAAAAVESLGLTSFHLVVHDAGGPVGFELVRRRPEAIRSLTILDTVVELPSTPFPGELWARVSGHAGPSWAPRRCGAARCAGSV